MSVAEQMMHGGGKDAYDQLLSQWRNTGELPRGMSVALFDTQPQDTLPVYYANAPKLGALPSSLASEIIKYHAKVVALQRIGKHFIGGERAEIGAAASIARAIEEQLAALNSTRPVLMSALSEFANRPTDWRNLLGLKEADSELGPTKISKDVN